MAETNNGVTLKVSLEKQSILKNCSSCGRRFGCGMQDTSCWCTDLPNLAADRIAFERDCMCPECLLQRINAPEAE